MDALGPLLEERGLPVHDPFAGTGERLGELCDSLGLTFTGTDLEDWPDRDPRVTLGDALDPRTYPQGARLIVTSPTYGNGMNDHHEARDPSRRHTYRAALGRPLHENNTGRYGIRRGRRSMTRYWTMHAEAITHWHRLGWPAVVNVKAFIKDFEVYDLPERWAHTLAEHGYRVTARLEVPCPGIRHGANHAARIDHEVILVAEVP